MATRAIHYNSARRAYLFIPVNGGALPDNLIENQLLGCALRVFADVGTRRLVWSSPHIASESREHVPGAGQQFCALANRRSTLVIGTLASFLTRCKAGSGGGLSVSPPEE